MPRRALIPLLTGLIAVALPSSLRAADNNPNGLALYREGSAFRVETDARNNIGLYVTKAGPRLGAKPGEQVFGGARTSGNWKTGRIAGTAFLLRKGCKPEGYEVAGTISGKGPTTTIVLEGVSPVAAKTGCGLGPRRKIHLEFESGVDD